MTEKRNVAVVVIFRAVTIVVILGVSVMIAIGLFVTKQPPAKAERRERAIRVELIEAKKIDVPVFIRGYGEVRARDVVQISPEVAGRIIGVHPRLEIGEIIPAGEVLFAIDPRDYEARLNGAKATVAQLGSALERLKAQYRIDSERLTTLERSCEVALAEHNRVKNLLKEDIGSQSSVDRSEMSYNAAKDGAAQLRQVVELYPIRIQEAENGLLSARAQEDLAEVSFERTVVKAPFNARLKEVRLEVGQYVALGDPVLTLANDSVLEISVALNSQEARRWLQFEARSPSDSVGWLTAVQQVPVNIYWTDGDDETRWTGRLHRVEKINQETRTLTVAVRIEGNEMAATTGSPVPLIEGMFCRVEIPGNVARDVIAIPVEAVGFDRDATGYRTAYLAKAGENGKLRLQSVRVREAYLDAEYVYVSEGIEEGARIVATRLVNPLEGSLLQAETDSGDEEPLS